MTKLLKIASQTSLMIISSTFLFSCGEIINTSSNTTADNLNSRAPIDDAFDFGDQILFAPDNGALPIVNRMNFAGNNRLGINTQGDFINGLVPLPIFSVFTYTKVGDFTGEISGQNTFEVSNQNVIDVLFGVSAFQNTILGVRAQEIRDLILAENDDPEPNFTDAEVDRIIEFFNNLEVATFFRNPQNPDQLLVLRDVTFNLNSTSTRRDRNEFIASGFYDIDLRFFEVEFERQIRVEPTINGFLEYYVPVIQTTPTFLLNIESGRFLVNNDSTFEQLTAEQLAAIEAAEEAAEINAANQ